MYMCEFNVKKIFLSTNDFPGNSNNGMYSNYNFSPSKKTRAVSNTHLTQKCFRQIVFVYMYILYRDDN